MQTLHGTVWTEADSQRDRPSAMDVHSSMPGLSPAYATSAEAMTPPAGLSDRVKRLILRGIMDRIRPLAYERTSDTVRCLTFHYLFPQEREHATRSFAALKREGDFITTAELVSLVDGSSRRRGRLFHLSVDDGFENIASQAHPILREAGIPYALMVCPAFIEKPADACETFRRNARYARPLPLADWATLAGLARENVEIGAHTLTHREVSQLSEDELDAEIAGCRAAVEARLPGDCTSFAWPFGRTTSMSERALARARASGYRAIFSSVRGSLQAGEGMPRYLPRHHFEPGWPISTVVYYATRAERRFVPPPLAA